MTEPIVTEVLEIDPRELKLLAVNPRYMRHETYKQLVDNIKRDGCLAGNTPFVVLEPDGKWLVLSGNHRVMAAIDAGLTKIRVEGTRQNLPEARRKAIQLSHNALVGTDDLDLLKKVYDEIDDVDWKKYAGLDDKTLDMLDDISPPSICDARTEYIPVTFLFLDHEVEDLESALEEMTKFTKSEAYYACPISQYDRFIEALYTVGRVHGVLNMALEMELLLRIFERNRGQLADVLIEEDATKHAIPLSVPLGTNRLSAKDARTLAMAVKKVMRETELKEPIQVLMKWAREANGV